MQCLQCQRENPGDARFCTGCRSSLDLICPACRTSNAPDSRSCKTCGNLVSTLATLQAGLRAATPQAYTPKRLADRIFTSRGSSTSLAGCLGHEAMHALPNRFFEVSLSEVHRYEWTTNQFLGDWFMAFFGASIAVQDHARRAVLAAQSFQRGMKEQQAAHGSPAGRAVSTQRQARLGWGGLLSVFLQR